MNAEDPSQKELTKIVKKLEIAMQNIFFMKIMLRIK